MTNNNLDINENYNINISECITFSPKSDKIQKELLDIYLNNINNIFFTYINPLEVVFIKNIVDIKYRFLVKEESLIADQSYVKMRFYKPFDLSKIKDELYYELRNRIISYFGDDLEYYSECPNYFKLVIDECNLIKDIKSKYEDLDKIIVKYNNIQILR